MSLSGKCVLVTGSSRGIGKAVALKLSNEGADVLHCARSLSNLEKTTSEIQSKGGKATHFQVDFADEKSFSAFLTSLESLNKPIDILVNNAAYASIALLSDLGIEEWDRTMQINLRSVFLLSQWAFNQMKVKKGGNIINISSIAGIYGPRKFAGLGAYVASKYALIGLTEMMAIEGKDNNIRVNCISPGGVDTEMFHSLFGDATASIQPEDVAELVYFLAHSSSKAMSGRNVELFSS